jgi:SAM-dependent methyltransferase
MAAGGTGSERGAASGHDAGRSSEGADARADLSLEAGHAPEGSRQETRLGRNGEAAFDEGWQGRHVDPPPTPRQLLWEYYDRRAKEYEVGLLIGVEDAADEIKTEATDLASLLRDMAPARFLDVGAGTGSFTRLVPGHGVAHDQSAAMLGRLQSRLGGIPCICGDALALPIRDRALDRLLAAHLYGHLDEVDRNPWFKQYEPRTDDHWPGHQPLADEVRHCHPRWHDNPGPRISRPGLGQLGARMCQRAPANVIYRGWRSHRPVSCGRVQGEMARLRSWPRS